MYNLNANEILMVDGGGDGGVATSYRIINANDIKNFGQWIASNSAWSAISGNRGNFSNNSGVGTGTSQSYGGSGLSVGGQMMGAEETSSLS